MGKSQLVTTEKVLTPNDVKRMENKKKIKSILNSTFYTIGQLLMSVYILFGDDFRHFVADKKSDVAFYVVTLICMIFFAIDICLWLYLYDNYLWSLMFYLDIVSWISLFFDLGWIYIAFFNSSNADSQGKLSYGARMAIISSRYAKYIEIMRYVRLIRIQNFLKFEKFFHEVKSELRERRERRKFIKMRFDMEKAGGDTNLTPAERKNSLFTNKKTLYPTFDVDIYNERKNKKQPMEQLLIGPRINSSGKQLSMNNTKRVIIIILIMIITIPLFKYWTYHPPLNAYNAEINIMQQMAVNTGQNPALIENWNQYTSFFDLTDRPLLSMTLYSRGSTNHTNVVTMVYRNTNITERQAYETYRPYELRIYNAPEDIYNVNVGQYFITAVFDDTNDNNVNAGISLLRTAFVLVVLFIFTVLFSRDANKLVLGPLHEMMEKIERIQQNPCKAAKEEFELMIRMKEKKNEYWKARELKEKEKYETSVLLNTLVKSGELLAIGFGEAGTEIIINHLNGQGLFANSEGKKVFCIFGFCDIRGFADVNDVLREGVMQFVNKIALLVHFIVDKYAGSVNKNIGDCFLLVWKFQENEIEKVFVFDDSGEEKVDIKLKDFSSQNNTITARCELAVLSFIEIILAINKSSTLEIEYNQNPKLLERIQNWRVNMGFGLHMGWAIEGAIGSEHKIDTSYLSPNVNLASRLEAATRQYGINLLISGQVYDHLSKDVQKLHRQVDVINAKGSKQAMRLFTFDMNLKHIEKTELITDLIKQRDFTSDDFNVYMIDLRKKLNHFHYMIFHEGLSTKSFYFDHPDIKNVRKIFTKGFYDTWDAGFSAYISGNWAEAYNAFSTTMRMIPGYTDGPSATLCKYLQSFNLVAPTGWKGVRSLTSK